jgi:hypothetical protein
MERYRSIVEDVGLYYVTFTVVEWLPVFLDERLVKSSLLYGPIGNSWGAEIFRSLLLIGYGVRRKHGILNLR